MDFTICNLKMRAHAPNFYSNITLISTFISIYIANSKFNNTEPYICSSIMHSTCTYGHTFLHFQALKIWDIQMEIHFSKATSLTIKMRLICTVNMYYCINVNIG